jgi:hypothetical protein
MTAVFGDDIDSVMTKGLKQQQGRDPALVKMERQLEEMQNEKKRAAEEAEAANTAREKEQQRSYATGQIQAILKEEENEVYQQAAEDPNFVNAVYSVMSEAYESGEYEMSVAEATDIVLDTLVKQVENMLAQRWMVTRRTAKQPENTSRPGTSVVKEAKAPAQTAQSHVRVSKTTGVSPNVATMDDSSFRTYLREAVERAQNEE